MITNEQLNRIYNNYNELANNNADVVTERNMHELLMFALDNPYVELDGDRITFAKGQAPFDGVEIERISGAEDLGSHFAIIMPASVILINKSTGDVNIYLPD